MLISNYNFCCQIPLVEFAVEKMLLTEETLQNLASLCSLACAAVRTDRDKDATPRAPLATSTGSIDSLGEHLICSTMRTFLKSVLCAVLDLSQRGPDSMKK